MGKRVKIPKGGNWEQLSRKHQRRFIDDGKLCYGCNEVRKLEEYYTTSPRCKYCMNKKNKERYKKQNKPLW